MSHDKLDWDDDIFYDMNTCYEKPPITLMDYILLGLLAIILLTPLVLLLILIYLPI